MKRSGVRSLGGGIFVKYTLEDEYPHLKKGCFYWVHIVLDVDAENDWENDYMPARYEGEERWTYLGKEGVSDWPVRWVGPEISELGKLPDEKWKALVAKFAKALQIYSGDER